jgi:ankyrin repeat protein/ppGpp synthetase/RelA/SpoT-type nucleotidyltranferase
MASTHDSSLCDRKVEEFLTKYDDKTRNAFKDLAEATGRRCQDLLKDMKIKGVVQSRAKAYDSLEKKLNDMAKEPEFISWVSPRKDIGVNEHNKRLGDIYEHPDMGDLAGVRIGLFFPGDILKVAQKINEIFNVSHTFGTITDTTRSAVTSRNRDIQKHGDGRWISQNAGEDVHHWEHYGYKSWQVVIGWKRPLPKDLSSIEADLAPTEVFDSLRVEIQVGTVVTQAWAEVQHNVIYKRPNNIQATPAMKRMIDAINGLAITTDIMLMELERSLAQAEKEAEKTRELEKTLPNVMLELASGNGDDEAVKRLLEAGADPNYKNNVRFTPLHMASLGGHDRIVELLLEAGADGNSKDSAGMTPINAASQGGYDRIVERLLKGGVDPNLKDTSGMTPLHTASRTGHDSIVEQLLEAGADANVAERIYRSTPLYIASRYGHDKTVERLLKGGADPSRKDITGRTPLHIASQNGRDRVVERLLKAGADMNEQDSNGFTALGIASRRNQDTVVKLLREAGAQ